MISFAFITHLLRTAMDRATRSPPHFAVAFAMNVPRERDRHAARERIFDRE
jgi:hypothetical protein